jgi:putative hemolysin
VGEISDGIVGAGKQFNMVGEHTYQLEGTMRIDEANEQLGLGLPDKDYETVA